MMEHHQKAFAWIRNATEHIGFYKAYHQIEFPGGSVIKNLSANAGDMDLIPGSGRSPKEGDGNPLQYSCLGNPTDRVA